MNIVAFTQLLCSLKKLASGHTDFLTLKCETSLQQVRLSLTSCICQVSAPNKKSTNVTVCSSSIALVREGHGVRLAKAMRWPEALHRYKIYAIRRFTAATQGSVPQGCRCPDLPLLGPLLQTGNRETKSLKHILGLKQGIQKILSHLSFLLSMLGSSSSTLTPTQMTEFLTLSLRLSLNTPQTTLISTTW